MTPRVIVLLSADEQLQQAAMTAAACSRRALRLASTVQHTLEVLQSSLDDVDLIILDIDSKICGVMLLNTLGFCCERIPVAVVTESEGDYALPIALSKGAVACFRKPVKSDDITSLVERIGNSPDSFARWIEDRKAASQV